MWVRLYVGVCVDAGTGVGVYVGTVVGFGVDVGTGDNVGLESSIGVWMWVYRYPNGRNSINLINMVYMPITFSCCKCLLQFVFLLLGNVSKTRIITIIIIILILRIQVW